nr:hypothetical protein CFP56_61038 [Quercus suber]
METEIESDDEFTNLPPGEVAVKLFGERKGKMCAPWANALIVKDFGKNVGYYFLHSKLLGMWKPIGKMDCVDLGHNFFLIKFSVKEDHSKLVEYGPKKLVDTKPSNVALVRVNVGLGNSAGKQKQKVSVFSFGSGFKVDYFTDLSLLNKTKDVSSNVKSIGTGRDPLRVPLKEIFNCLYVDDDKVGSSVVTACDSISRAPLKCINPSLQPRKKNTANEGSLQGHGSPPTDRVGPLDHVADDMLFDDGDMNMLIWNCQGAFNLNFHNLVSDLIRKHYPAILVIMETKVSGDRAKIIADRLLMDEAIFINNIGLSGGL